MPFVAPLRYIFDLHDHQTFSHSLAHEELLKFIGAINNAVIDKSTKADCVQSETVVKVKRLLESLSNWIDEIPPIKQSMRYGNKAYRTWHSRLVHEAPSLCQGLLSQDKAGAEIELAPYLCDSFGNPTRIDYGTGHETCFVIFLYCLCKLGMCGPADLPALGLVIFPAYLQVARKLQRTYWLEPAGSHGVWSLDDYQFLVFLFGSAQLANHPHIKPRSIHSAEVLETYAEDYMYLAAVQFINQVKFGAPFAEHSPILNDISELPSWGKVNEGLAKMYRGEVLGKLPVVQHFVFGSLFKADWTPSRAPVPSETVAHALAGGPLAGYAYSGGLAMEAAATSAGQVPVDEPEQAVAPWVTEPIPAAAARTPLRAAVPTSSSSGGSGERFMDPTLTGVAPWARASSGVASPGAAGTSFASAGRDRPSPHAHLTGSAPASALASVSPSGQGQSTVTSFLEAFGPLAHITPRQAEANAAANEEAEASALTPVPSSPSKAVKPS